MENLVSYECDSCKATGLYRGAAELHTRGLATTCYNCNGGHRDAKLFTVKRRLADTDNIRIDGGWIPYEEFLQLLPEPQQEGTIRVECSHCGATGVGEANARDNDPCWHCDGHAYLDEVPFTGRKTLTGITLVQIGEEAPVEGQPGSFHIVYRNIPISDFLLMEEYK